jgi:hypothetical protein
MGKLTGTCMFHAHTLNNGNDKCKYKIKVTFGRKGGKTREFQNNLKWFISFKRLKENMAKN